MDREDVETIFGSEVNISALKYKKTGELLVAKITG
jgi:hypothetical protein